MNVSVGIISMALKAVVWVIITTAYHERSLHAVMVVMISRTTLYGPSTGFVDIKRG